MARCAEEFAEPGPCYRLEGTAVADPLVKLEPTVAWKSSPLCSPAVGGSITVTFMASQALSLFSPRFQASFSSATAPISTLVLLSIWMMNNSFSFCLPFAPSLCSNLSQPERLR